MRAGVQSESLLPMERCPPDHLANGIDAGWRTSFPDETVIDNPFLAYREGTEKLLSRSSDTCQSLEDLISSLAVPGR